MGVPIDSEQQRLTASLADRYAIERELGRGGMATVYLARDLRHDRRVAVKVLHPDLAAALGSERFLAEIRTTANLQHPHILPLHDSGDAGGFLFYVMPYVEGETLRRLLEREHQLPIDDALRLTCEVLSALDYAHRHGVIHRDIKPENVLVHDGRAVVADFGIALAVQSASGARMTQTGLSLGTPSYMSPEQAMGEKSIDGRADIYAVGAMLYEMLTGDPPFSGSTVQAIVAKVITERPTPPRTVRDTVPPGVEQAVLKSLAKLAADRFATAAQFSEALTHPVSTIAPSMVSAIPSTGERRRSRMLHGALAASLVALAVTSVFAWRWLTRLPAARVAFEVDGHIGASWQIEASPEGTRLLLMTQVDSTNPQRQIAIRDVGTSKLQLMPGTAGVSVFNWSPDGREIVYGTARQLFRVAASAGGVPRPIATDSLVGIYGNPTWGADDLILFSDGGHTAVVPASGGKIRHVFHDSLKLPLQVVPRFLPDGKRFLFTTGYHSSVPGVWIGSLDGSRPKQILPLFTKAMASQGLLFYANPGGLVAQPFDVRTGVLSGEPIRVADDVTPSPSAGEAPWSISRAGMLAYQKPALAARMQLRWFDRNGKATETTGDAMMAQEMNLSPDGKSVAISIASRDVFDVWTMNLETRILTRVTSDSASNSPIWMPDSRTLIYQRIRNSAGKFMKRVIGGGAEEVVREYGSRTALVGDVSPDGKTLGYWQAGQLLTFPLSGGEPVVKLARPGIGGARFSPDGNWMSFSSRETGTWEVYVATYPSFNRVMRVSPAGGVQGRWRADSRELLYLTTDGRVMSVVVNPQSADPFHAPVELFRSPLVAPAVGNDEWSVTRDAQRFLFLAPADTKQEGRRPINVILNWRPERQ